MGSENLGIHNHGFAPRGGEAVSCRSLRELKSKQSYGSIYFSKDFFGPFQLLILIYYVLYLLMFIGVMKELAPAILLSNQRSNRADQCL